jgi:predicted phage tail component-like protein
MNLQISFNGKNSLTDLGLDIETRIDVPIPKKRLTKVEVPGRDGSLTISEDALDDITISVPFNFQSEEFENVCTNVKNWLTNITDNKLILNNEDSYYLVNEIVCDKIEQTKISEVSSKGTFTLKLICNPIKYDILGQDIITITSATTLQNQGRTSRPYFKIYGSGTINLVVNGVTSTYTSVTDYIEVDSDLMDCYKGTVAKNNTMTGVFPLFTNGSNSVSYSGTVTKIEIKPRWCDL